MPLTKTVLHNGNIIAGGNTGGISTGLAATALEFCILIEATAAAGVSSQLEIKNSLNAVFTKAVYGVAGSLQVNGGYYILSGSNFDSIVAENTGSETLNVKITLLSTDVLTFIPVNKIINTKKMFSKEEMIRLVELNTGKKVIDCEPHNIGFINTAVPVIKQNYIYFGNIDFISNATSIVTTCSLVVSLEAAQSPNYNMPALGLLMRHSYDGVSINRMYLPNAMFNKLGASAGSYYFIFTGWRLKIE